MYKAWNTPEGEYPVLFQSMLNENHLLIAGCTGSGKSVLENGLIYTSLYNSPSKTRLVLIDPKLNELIDYKDLPHCLLYADNRKDIINALQAVVNIMEERNHINQQKRKKLYNGSRIYVVIDELQDLMTTCKKQCFPLIQRIAQIGRSANIMLICCTQSPIAKIIPTELKCNFSARVGLKTISKQDSRNILDMNGCETLPEPKEAKKAYGFYRSDGHINLYVIPKIDDQEHKRIIEHWRKNRKPSIMFGKP